MNSECHIDAVHKAPTEEERRGQASTVLAVEGMGCPNCAQRVRNGLLNVYGVVSAEVDLAARQARVTYNPSLVADADLERAVFEAGRAARHSYQAHTLG